MLKKGLFLATVCLLLLACTGSRKNQNQDKNSERFGTIQADTIPQKNVVTATISNSEGVSLTLKFDKARKTCEIEFDGEKAELTQQRMASGIKYSNDHYVYTEWHGEIRLYKDRKLVFSHGD